MVVHHIGTCSSPVKKGANRFTFPAVQVDVKDSPFGVKIVEAINQEAGRSIKQAISGEEDLVDVARGATI